MSSQNMTPLSEVLRLKNNLKKKKKRYIHIYANLNQMLRWNQKPAELWASSGEYGHPGAEEDTHPCLKDE